MSPPGRANSVRRMSEAAPHQPEAVAGGLVAEIEHYLAAVELFRREECEPQWRSCEELDARRLLCHPSRKRIINTDSGGR
jgi:hypothetical protein